MHEFHIADQIVKNALSEAEKHNGTGITLMRLKLGSRSHITPESLETCILAAAKGTIAENVKLDIELFSETITCKDCLQSSPVSTDKMTCPRCSSKNVHVTNEEDVYLESLQIEQPD